MKMLPGTGTISNYSSFTRNCTLGQLPYKIPINSISDIQLYVDIGTIKPTTVLYELIHTCGDQSGDIESVSPDSYVVAQDKNNRWYGVFKDFTVASGVSLSCFVIAITLDGSIYFSEEYCIEGCADAIAVEGCYGLLDADISRDCNGIYFGIHAGTGVALGNTHLAYRHKVFLRGVDVTLASIKNSFKQGRTRTFRTEKEKIFQFWSEIVPEWYLSEVDAVFYRGEVKIDGTKYLLNETAFEKVDECLKQWNTKSTLRESCYQSFSCEDDPCASLPESCCDPVVIGVTVDVVAEESQSSGFPPPPSTYDEIIVIESKIGGVTTVSGTTDPVTGLSAGSSVVTCAGFAGVRVMIMRGNLPLPGIDPGSGQSYYTKNLADNFITFSDPLVSNEIIYIETIV